MNCTRKSIDNGAARWLLAVVALALSLGVPLATAAQAPPAPVQDIADAPPAPRDARFGTPGEQNQPGASDLSAGRVAVMNSRWQEALDHFRSVVQDYPDGELADDATYWWAKCLYELGRYEDAVARVNDMANRYPRSNLLSDARVVRFEAAEQLVQRGNADYERYLVDAAAPQAPRPTTPTSPTQSPDAPEPVSPESELRLMALDALINMDPESAWPVLQRLVQERDDPELRGRAVWLLSQLGSDEAFDLLIDIARNDDDPEVRGNALFWVGQSDEHREQAMDLLIEMVNSDGDSEFAGQALFGLGQSDDPRARAALEALAKDRSKDVELRGQALFWLGQQGGDALDVLRDILLSDSDEELRGQALFGISQMDSPEAAATLLALARDTTASAEMRGNAIFYLGQRSGGAAIDDMLELWEQIEDTEVRDQLMFALAQTDDDRAIDHLVSVAKDAEADPELRQQAIFWLGQSNNPKAKAALLEIIGNGEQR